MLYDILKTSSDTIGIIGVILLLLSYFGLNTGRIRTDTFWYPFSNCIAASLILFSLYFNWNTPSVLIECAWIIISLIGIYRIVKSRSRE